MADKHSIQVTARSEYLAEKSDERRDHYVFAYTITIRNTGTEAAQLISRHWIISDGSSKEQEVKGLGVVGAQPTLKPGETFEYTSGAAIRTSVGTMRGIYHMVGADGSRFEAPIPAFTLSVPRVLH